MPDSCVNPSLIIDRSKCISHEGFFFLIYVENTNVGGNSAVVARV